jgi:tetratricopeptide (TPR) repeat protein
VVQSFTTGNDALNANKLDEAIAAYREGLRVRPDEPALLTNFAEALRRRGVIAWNEGLKAEGAAKDAKRTAAKNDWTESAASSAKALQTLNQFPAEQQQQPAFLQTKTAAASTRALAMGLVASKVDQTQAGAAWDANVEYVALTSDSTEKSKLKGEGLQMLFEAGAFDLAILHSRAVLKEEPQNLDASRVLGLALFATGDKVKMAEALPHLQQYVDKAPATDPQKENVKQAIEVIKAQKP